MPIAATVPKAPGCGVRPTVKRPPTRDSPAKSRLVDMFRPRTPGNLVSSSPASLPQGPADIDHSNHGSAIRDVGGFLAQSQRLAEFQERVVFGEG